MPSDDLFAGLFGDLPSPELPVFLTSHGARGTKQDTVISSDSRYSQNSHTKNDQSRNFEPNASKIFENSRPGSRVEDTCVSDVGTAGIVGTWAKTPAVSETSLFPPPSLLIGKEKEKREIPGAAPQPRPEWLTDPSLTALAPGLPPLPDDDGGLPIPPATIRSAVERELRDLASVGRGGAGALRDAVELVRARVANAPALAPGQMNASMCVSCGASLNDGSVVISVLTGKPNHIVYLHAGCHDAHRVKHREAVERVMVAAGFPSEVAP